MTNSEHKALCKGCSCSGTGKFCAYCGQAYQVKRITLHGLLHDVFHFFTHLDKGFGFTLKQLFVAPGSMQRSYIEGDRARHQKPFSLFFICATIAGLGRYWIFLLLQQYNGEGNASEAKFFHEYMLLLQVVLMPFNILLTWLLFYKSKYNYAETGVFLLYNVSFFFLMVTFISLLKFIWPKMDTAFIELPVLIIYNSISFLNFYKEDRKWLVISKSIILIAFIFFITQLLEDFAISILS